MKWPWWLRRRLRVSIEWSTARPADAAPLNHAAGHGHSWKDWG